MNGSAWPTTLLGEVINLKRGYDLPHQDRRPGPYPVVSSSGITDHHAEHKAKGPGVVTGRYGTLGEVFYIPMDYWPLNTSLYVQDFKGNDPRFISYFLTTLTFAGQTAAGAVPGVYRNHLHALEVRVPPLAEQRRIAGILSAYDDLIANCQRRIRILEEMARHLYREWFVHLRYPGHESISLVPIPQGWELVPMGQALTSMTGGDWGANRRTELETEEVGVVRGTDFEEVAYGGNLRVPVRFIKPGSFVSRGLRIGDILIENSVNAKSRCIGTTLMVDEHVLARLGRAAIAASFCKVLRPSSLAMAPLIHLHVRRLREDASMEYYQNVAANGIGNFQAQKFAKEEHIPLPTDRVVRADLLEGIATPLRLVGTLASQLSNLRQTRDLLLPRLLSP